MIRSLHRGNLCIKRRKRLRQLFEDTMKAGHYENRKESVDIMIRNSRDIINDLVKYGVEFEKKGRRICLYKRGSALQTENPVS